jgi:tRNA G37 N-methylase Trm5
MERLILTGTDNGGIAFTSEMQAWFDQLVEKVNGKGPSKQDKQIMGLLEEASNFMFAAIALIPAGSMRNMHEAAVNEWQDRYEKAVDARAIPLS